MSEMQNHRKTQEFLDWAFAQRVNSTEEKIVLIVFAMFANIDGTAIITLLDLSRYSSIPLWEIDRIIDGVVGAQFVSAELSADGEVCYRLLMK